MDEIYALLWSRSSNCFHIEPLADTVSSGMRFFRKDARNDYLLIGYGPRDLMESKAEHLRPVITERAEVRRLYDDQ